MNIDLLKDKVKKGMTIGVFGTSHSSTIILMNLVELGVNVINFYHNSFDPKYAVYHDGWIEKDNTGLKGNAAIWAKSNLEKDCLNPLV